MRWTEIEAQIRDGGGEPGEGTAPSYRLWDLWTRQDRLTANHLRGQGGKYRDWPDAEVEVGMFAARLKVYGMTDDLAFKVARHITAMPGDVRRMWVGGHDAPRVAIEVRFSTADE